MKRLGNQNYENSKPTQVKNVYGGGKKTRKKI